MSSKDNVIIKLIDLSEKQNELIFATRERLFKLERTQNKDVKVLCGMSIGICVVLILMCVQFGGLTW
tara:strand:+ start:257 stop:457 length:201 start_codon:yes stop_codon:yes gene_type:complete